MTEICTIETGRSSWATQNSLGELAHWRSRWEWVSRPLIAPGAALAETDETPSTSASTDRTALIMGGTTIPTPDDYLVELIKNQYIAPTHPGQDIDYVAVTTPQEAGPSRGSSASSGSHSGPRASGGLVAQGGGRTSRCGNSRGYSTSPSISRSRPGSANLETAMAEHGNDPLVIYGVSQGSIIATAGEAQARRAVPGGNRGPRYRLRDAGHAESAQRRACLPASRASTFRSSIGRSTAPRRPTPSSTRS